MNRKQRRSAKHRGAHAASQALFQDELRRALRTDGVQLVSCVAGEQGDEPRWVIEVRRGDTRMFMQSPPKTVEGLVKGIMARLNGEEPVELVQPPVAVAVEAPKVATELQRDVTIQQPVVHYEDLSRYLDEDFKP